MWPYDQTGEQPENDLGVELFSLGGRPTRTRPLRIFDSSRKQYAPSYGNTGGIPAVAAPPSAPLDPTPTLATPWANMQTPQIPSYRQAWERRYGVPMEQRPAPVEDAVVKPNWDALHFDP